MNLARLPAEFIEEAFDDPQHDLLRNEALLKIMGPFFYYDRTTWINGKGKRNSTVLQRKSK